MKKILLLSLLIPVFGFSQTRTTTMNGDFYNPLIWNPVGLPASGETVIINHTVTMNLDIYYTAGSITINAGGSLIEDATDRAFWADGTGSLINHGTFTAHLVALSPGALLTNTGNLQNIDSLWNRGTINMSPTATATLFDFWNDQTGVFTNAGTLQNADSLLNQGSFSNSGTAMVYDYLNDEMATTNNIGELTITNNMNNQGYYTNAGNIDLGNDFSNCNLQTLDAMFINNGIFCIASDMTNCIDDTLTGSGDYYIGGLCSNFGVFAGTHTFHTPSGTVNIPGNIQPSVTVTTGACDLSISENQTTKFVVYPNPANTDLTVPATGVNFQLFDYAGNLVNEGTVINYTIELANLQNGMYTVLIDGLGTSRFVKN